MKKKKQPVFKGLTDRIRSGKGSEISLLSVFFLFLTISCGPLFPTGKPFFWKVEKDGKTSYFLGTNHYGISLKELPCSGTILKKLKSSDLVLTELGEGIQDTRQLKEWKQTFTISPNNEDFNRLSPESQKFLEQKGISKELTYFNLGYELHFLCLKKAIGEKTALTSMDAQVEFVATRSNIPLQALDTLELRKPVIKHITTKEDIEKQIKFFPLCLKYIRYDIATYKSGEEPSAPKGLNKWLHNRYSTGEFDQWALKHRNEKWATQFKKAHQNHDRIFMAAGLYHFTRAFNLIDMLRRDGFDIERVSCQDSLHNEISDQGLALYAN